MKINPETPVILRNLNCRSRKEISSLQSEIFIIEEGDMERARKMLYKHDGGYWDPDTDEFKRRPLRFFYELISAMTYGSSRKDARTQDVFDAFPELTDILAVNELLRSFQVYDLVCRQQKVLKGMIDDLISVQSDDDENDELTQMVVLNKDYFTRWGDENWRGEELLLLEPLTSSNHWMIQNWR